MNIKKYILFLLIGLIVWVPSFVSAMQSYTFHGWYNSPWSLVYYARNFGAGPGGNSWAVGLQGIRTVDVAYGVAVANLNTGNFIESGTTVPPGTTLEFIFAPMNRGNIAWTADSALAGTNYSDSPNGYWNNYPPSTCNSETYVGWERATCYYPMPYGAPLEVVYNYNIYVAFVVGSPSETINKIAAENSGALINCSNLTAQSVSGYDIPQYYMTCTVPESYAGNFSVDLNYGATNGSYWYANSLSSSFGGWPCFTMEKLYSGTSGSAAGCTATAGYAGDYNVSIPPHTFTYNFTVPKIDGVCPTPNPTVYNSGTTSFTPCVSGTVANVVWTANNTIATYDCVGSSNGGATASGCQAKFNIKGACGTANGLTVDSVPTTNPSLCQDGVSPVPTVTTNGNNLTWSCAGLHYTDNGNSENTSVSCSASLTPPTNGACTTPNPKTYPSGTTTFTPCLTGNYTTPTWDSTGTVATYGCIGINGGTSTPTTGVGACVAQFNVNGVCGTAAGQTSLNHLPSTNPELCQDGFSSPDTTPVTQSGTGGRNLSWSCAGKYYGGTSTSVLCTATMAVTNGTCLSPNPYIFPVGTTSWDPCAGGNPTTISWDVTNTIATYGCSGVAGGTSTTATACSAKFNMAGVCGTANGQTLTSMPSSNPALCQDGFSTPPTVTQNGTALSWTCAGKYYGGTSTNSPLCTATITVTAGSCGTNPTIYPAGSAENIVCGAGTPTNILWDSTHTIATYTCHSTTGGSDATNCQSKFNVKGACGTAQGQYLGSIPNSNPALCQDGVSSPATTPVTQSGTTSIKDLNWTCLGTNYGGASTSTGCVAFFAPSGAGACGTNSTTYAPGTGFSPTGSFCSAGVPKPANPLFPGTRKIVNTNKSWFILGSTSIYGCAFTSPTSVSNCSGWTLASGTLRGSAVDSLGNVWVADSSNNRLIKGGPISAFSLTNGGSGYTSLPTVTISDSGGGSGATLPVANVGGITNVTGSWGFGGYNLPSSGNISVSFTGGGATTSALATANVNGSILDGTTPLNFSNFGSFYTSAPAVNFSVNNIGRSGTITAARATAVMTGTSLTGVTPTSGGAYGGTYETASGPTISFAGKGCTVVPVMTPIITAGQLTGVNVTNYGTGCPNPVTPTLTGGSGTGAAVTFSTSGGAINGITSITGGSGYGGAPSVWVLDNGAGFFNQIGTSTLSGTSVNSINLSAGVVNSITLGARGSGYTSAPTPIISAPPAGGTTATATAKMGEMAGFSYPWGGVGYNLPGNITWTGVGGGCTTQPSGTAVVGVNYVSVTNGGSGYTSNPTVSFSGGGGSGVTATAVRTGTTVTGVTITSYGSNYSSAPAVSFSGGGGSGATATAYVGQVTSTTVDSWGLNCTSTPGIKFNYGTFNGARATAVLSGGTTGNLIGINFSTANSGGGSGYASAPGMYVYNAAGTQILYVGSTTLSGGSVATTTYVANASATGYTSVPAILFYNGSYMLPAATISGYPGQVTSLTLTNGGSGYVTAPAVSFSGGGGSGATATTTLSATPPVYTGGKVPAILFYYAPAGYPNGIYYPAMGVTVGPGQVTSITGGTGGNGYVTPSVSFTGGGGSGATASANNLTTYCASGCNYNITLNSPYGVAIDADNNVWVTNYNSANVTKVNGATGASMGNYTTGTGPYGVAIDSNNDVWVANNTANTVTKIRTMGAGTSTSTTYTVGAGPKGISVDAYGNVWTANSLDNNVSKIDPSKSVATAVTNYSPGVTNPSGVASDTNGNTFIAYGSSVRGINQMGQTVWGPTDFGISSQGVSLAGKDTGYGIWPSSVLGASTYNFGDNTGYALQNFVLGGSRTQQPYISNWSCVGDTSSNGATANCSATICTAGHCDPTSTAQPSSPQSYVLGNLCTSGIPSPAYPLAPGTSVSVNTPSVYTTNYNSNSVTKINVDGSTGATYSSVSSGSPGGIAVLPNIGEVITSWGDNTATVINSSGGTGTIFTGSGAAGVAVDARVDDVYHTTWHAWIANSNINAVTEVDLATNGVVNTHSIGLGLNNPVGVAVDPDGNIWISNYGNGTGNTVTKINRMGILLGAYTVGAGPYGIAIDSTGSVWTANYGTGTGNTVSRLVKSGTVYNLVTYTVGSGARGIAIDSSGIAWVSNYAANKVYRIDPNSASLPADTGITFSNPFGISADSSGNVWVSNYGSSNGVNGVTKIITANAPTSYTSVSYATGNKPMSFGDFTGLAFSRIVSGGYKGTQASPSTWTCQGVNGGTSESCSVNMGSLQPGQCGSSAGQTLPQGTTSVQNPCSRGNAVPVPPTASYISVDHLTGLFQWYCQVIGATPSYQTGDTCVDPCNSPLCSAHLVLGGSCGTAHQQSISGPAVFTNGSFYDYASNNLFTACASGAPYTISGTPISTASDFQWSNGTASWVCHGVLGGTNSSTCTVTLVQTAAVCSTAYDAGVSSTPLSPGDSLITNPCSSGTLVAPPGVTGDGISAGGYWQWQCSGSSGNVSCSAPANGGCGSKAKTFEPGESNAGTTFCASGTTTGYTWRQNADGIADWTCNPINDGTAPNGSSANCSAIFKENGACGQANLKSYTPSEIDGLFPEDFCNTGIVSAVTQTATTWDWTCNGVNTDASGNASCHADITVTAECGSADGVAVKQVPTTNLCSPGMGTAGPVTDVSGHIASTGNTNGGWSWTCTNSGTSVGCGAPLEVECTQGSDCPSGVCNVNGHCQKEPPQVIGMGITAEDYEHSGCGAGTAWFGWTYFDINGLSQTKYQIQIEEKSLVDVDGHFDANNVKQVVNRTVSGLSNASGLTNSQAITIGGSAGAPVQGSLSFGKTYYWRVRVWNSEGTASNWYYGGTMNTWQNSTVFSTPAHAFPCTDFDCSVPTPVGQVTTNNANCNDASHCYDSNNNIISCGTVAGGADANYTWNFGDGKSASGKSNKDLTGDTTGTIAHPTHVYVVTDSNPSFDLTLQVCESISGKTVCNSSTKRIHLKTFLTPPEWKEISPF